MTEEMLAGWLTPAFYIFLFALTVWVVAHGIEIFSGGNRDLDPTDACLRLEALAETMEDKVDKIEAWAEKLVEKVQSHKEIEGATKLLSRVLRGVYPEPVHELVVHDLAKKIRNAKPEEASQLFLKEVPLKEVAKEEIQDHLNGLAHNRAMGPGEDIAAWFEGEGVPSPFVKHILGQAEAGNDPEEGSKGRTFLAHEASEYSWRLGVVTKIAPIAGMAPTMTGAMKFLGDYSGSLKEGSSQLPLAGLNTALFTTCWGCCLAIAAAVLSTYVLKRKIPGARAVVQEIENPIMEAHARWKDVVDSSSSLEKGRSA